MEILCLTVIPFYIVQKASPVLNRLERASRANLLLSERTPTPKADRLITILNRLLCQPPLADRQREAVDRLRRRVAVPVTAMQPALLHDPQQLSTESAPEQVVGNEVYGRVDNDQKRADLVKRVQRDALEDLLRFIDEGPDDPRDKRWSLTDEENDDYADKHHRRVDSSTHDGADLPRAPA